MRLLVRTLARIERPLTAVVVAVTRVAAFVLRRGRYSGWQQARERAAIAAVPPPR